MALMVKGRSSSREEGGKKKKKACKCVCMYKTSGRKKLCRRKVLYLKHLLSGMSSDLQNKLMTYDRPVGF